jgi:hypothetical protein
MKPGTILDLALETLLGTAAPDLRVVGAVRGLRWVLDRRLAEGQSGAIVAFVYELDRDAGATKYLMKVDSCPDIELDQSEFARHRAAFRDAPTFARSYLTELAPEGHDLVPVGDGRWIVFQRVAAMAIDEMHEEEDVHDLDVLSKALASVCAGGPVPATGTSTEESVSCSPEVFVRFCGRVTDVVLREWVGKPDLELMDASQYLRTHLLKRMEDGRPLRTIAGLLKHDWLLIGVDREPLPNPFVLLRANGVGPSLPVKALLGRAHGDLHTGNILVPVTTLTDDALFRLVDLANYDSHAPLARDPTGMLLGIVVRVLRYLDEPAQEAIGQLLLCDENECDEWIDELPAWLGDLAACIRRVAERWAYQHVQLADWRPQWRLSLIGCALILLGRRSTRAEDRMWLLRFAARATRGALGSTRLPLRTEATEVTPEMLVAAPPAQHAARDESWVEWFCDYRPRLSRKADELGVRDQLDSLRRAALDGEHREDEFLELVRKVDGKAFTTRDAGEDEALVDEVFTCPLEKNRCTKVSRPQPGEDRPRCSVLPGGMRHEFW